MDSAGISAKELKEIKATFQYFDSDGSGKIDASELGEVLKAIGEKNVTSSKVKKLIAEVDANNDGEIDWEEFLQIVKNSRSGKGSSMGNVVQKAAKLHVKQKGSIVHSYDEEERFSFADFINYTLENDKHLKKLLPIDPDDESLFSACKNGILLCKLINVAAAKTIDERAINTKKLTKFTIQENCTLAVNSAKAIGCNLVNIGAKDIQQGEPIALLSQINLKNVPGLVLLLEPGEELSDLLKLSPEQILLRWINYHCKNGGYSKKVKNLGKDIADSQAYTILLNQISKQKCSLSPQKVSDDTKRAGAMLKECEKLPGARKFVRPKDVVKGNKKLNLAFVANLFNLYPCLELEEPVDLSELDDGSGSIEARTYTRFMNSLGLSPVLNNLFEDTKDGLAWLKVLDILAPGTVDWKKVEKKKLNQIKKVSNNNLVIKYAKAAPFNLSLVGIGGKNLAEGQHTGVFALAWQLMRFEAVRNVEKLFGGKVGDKDILKKANGTLVEDYREYKLRSFNDSSIETGYFMASLCESNFPGSIDWDEIAEPSSRDDCINNISYAISRSRAKGANVFCVPDAFVPDEEANLDKIFRAKQSSLFCVAILASK